MSPLRSRRTRLAAGNDIETGDEETGEETGGGQSGRGAIEKGAEGVADGVLVQGFTGGGATLSPFRARPPSNKKRRAGAVSEPSSPWQAAGIFFPRRPPFDPSPHKMRSGTFTASAVASLPHPLLPSPSAESSRGSVVDTGGYQSAFCVLSPIYARGVCTLYLASHACPLTLHLFF